LKVTRCRTGSQWSDWRTGVMWSVRLVPVTRRADTTWKPSGLVLVVRTAHSGCQIIVSPVSLSQSKQFSRWRDTTLMLLHSTSSFRWPIAPLVIRSKQIKPVLYCMLVINSDNFRRIQKVLTNLFSQKTTLTDTETLLEIVFCYLAAVVRLPLSSVHV